MAATSPACTAPPLSVKLNAKNVKTTSLLRGVERFTAGWKELAFVQCDSDGSHWLGS